MESIGLGVQVLSAPTYLFGYELPVGEGVEACAAYNDVLAQDLARPDTRGRFPGLVLVRLQEPARSTSELKRAIALEGVLGVSVGTWIGESELDSPALDHFYEMASETVALVLVHPNVVGAPERMRGFHLAYSVGLPAETAFATARLILGGVFDRHPGLRICLSHRGGLFFLSLARLGHLYQEFPGAYVDTLFADTVVHCATALQALVKIVGSERRLLGTDYPASTGVSNLRALLVAARDDSAPDMQAILAAT